MNIKQSGIESKLEIAKKRIRVGFALGPVSNTIEA